MLQSKPRIKPLNDVSTDVDDIRSLLPDAFSSLGINYQNKTVAKPISKKTLATLVSNEFGLSLNLKLATECLIFCKTIDD